MAVVHLEEPKFRGFVAGTNAPLIGGKVYVYDAGTSDLATIYTSQDAGTEHTNPVILDANGEAEIWYNSSVKVIVKDSDDVQQYSFDNIVANIEPTVSGVYNLVQNGGFETDSDADGEPDNWTLVPDTNGTIAIDSTTGNHSNGANSLKFTSGGSGGGSAITTPYSEVTASGYVQVAFRLKSSVATVKNIVTILWYQNSAGLASSTASTAVYSDTATNPTSWTYKSFSAAVPSDAYYCKIKIEGVESSGTTVTAASNTHYDDIRLLAGPVIFPNVTVPITADDSEINKLDGLTSSQAELNTLDGFTGDVADLNYAETLNEVSDVNINELEVITGKTFNIKDDSGFKIADTAVTSTAAELNILDGVTATTTELNYADGPNTATKFCLLDSNAEVAIGQSLFKWTYTSSTTSSITGSGGTVDVSVFNSLFDTAYQVDILAKGATNYDVTAIAVWEDGLARSFDFGIGGALPSVPSASANNLVVRFQNNHASAQTVTYTILMRGL